MVELITSRSKTERFVLTGYFCPFFQDQPAVLELDNVQGAYVPVFRDRELLRTTMANIGSPKYSIERVSDGSAFLDAVQQAGALVVVNPRTGNGISIWDAILPSAPSVQLPQGIS